MSTSKRRIDRPSTPVHSKRRKDTQSRLDSFFSSPSVSERPGKVKADSFQKSIAKDIEIIDVDLLDDDVVSAPEHQSSSSPKKNSSALRPVKLIQAGRKDAFANVQHTTPDYAPLAVDPSTYTTSHFISQSTDTPYSFLAHTLSTINSTRSRTAILNTLTNTFRTILVHHPQSLLPSLYLLSNTLAPPYSTLELNIGPSVISQAIQQVSGLTSASLRKLYSSTGDPGDVAFMAKSTTRTLIPHAPLLVTGVYKSLLKIAACKGQGAIKEKQKIVEKLLVSAKGEEIRFLVRTLSQNLRVGAVRTSLLTVLARSFVLTPRKTSKDPSFDGSAGDSITTQSIASDSNSKSIDIAQDTLSSRFRSAEHLLRKVFVQHPSYDHIVGALLEVGLDGLPQRVPLTVGIPVYPALGSPIRSFEEIYERLNDLPFSAELKYDGQRAQIHVLRQSDGPIDVRVFSRHLEDMTSKYPDVTGLMQVLLEIHPETQSLILDSEIVAIDRATGSLKSFQALSSRARKDVRLEKVEISVGVFVFDLLYLDGEILLDRSFRTRRSLMRNRFPSYIPENELLAQFQHVDSCDSEESQIQLQNFWETAVSRHDTEGLMIKLLDHEVCDEDSKGKLQARKKPLSAIYDADKRTFSWMKLKKDYVSGIGDSLDLIPIGAWYGNGRKAKWWSPILLGIWDPDQGHPVAICKCMSGFTDAFYKILSEQFSLDDASKCSRSRLWDCEFGGFKPDVYFKPDMVWEIRGADITLSPISIAACHLTSSSKGLSLRFPRFIRVRDDKTIMQASDASFLANLWKSQQGKLKEQDDELIDVDVDSTGDYSEMDDIDI
ncbi:ATP-dependent DNA ligase [Lentinula edodes]|uniref:ATP-dependent DNA ligase n=1 Tax=Lentinula edodes TaxID=5353 RepID=UPI001E8EA18D|nr:ATP-dependent DNA ligase [Lentinula edodes]KAH7874590.1 ATP-dependent DNA ligase [Lentinula edodes]